MFRKLFFLFFIITALTYAEILLRLIGYRTWTKISVPTNQYKPQAIHLDSVVGWAYKPGNYTFDRSRHLSTPNIINQSVSRLRC